MTVPWEPPQRGKVEKILSDDDLDSGECRKAAEQILPIALAHDPQAEIMKITPVGRARYVPTKVKLKKPWYHHYTTTVSFHYVDILTGAGGTPFENYREEHWAHPEWIDIKPL